jgi:hypothetical protein
MAPEATIFSYSSIVIRWIRGGTQAGTSGDRGTVDVIVDMGLVLQFDYPPIVPRAETTRSALVETEVFRDDFDIERAQFANLFNQAPDRCIA